MRRGNEYNNQTTYYLFLSAFSVRLPPPVRPMCVGVNGLGQFGFFSGRRRRSTTNICYRRSRHRPCRETGKVFRKYDTQHYVKLMDYEHEEILPAFFMFATPAQERKARVVWMANVDWGFSHLTMEKPTTRRRAGISYKGREFYEHFSNMYHTIRWLLLAICIIRLFSGMPIDWRDRWRGGGSMWEKRILI